MEVRCDKCQARYRVDDARIGPQGLTMRCGKCQNTFKVMREPAATVPNQPPAPKPAAPPAQQRAAAARPAEASPQATMVFGQSPIAKPAAPPPKPVPAAAAPAKATPVPADEGAGRTMMFQTGSLKSGAKPKPAEPSPQATMVFGQSPMGAKPAAAPAPKPPPRAADPEAGATIVFGQSPIAKPAPKPSPARDEAAGSTMMFGQAPAVAKPVVPPPPKAAPAPMPEPEPPPAEETPEVPAAAEATAAEEPAHEEPTEEPADEAAEEEPAAAPGAFDRAPPKGLLIGVVAGLVALLIAGGALFAYKKFAKRPPPPAAVETLTAAQADAEKDTLASIASAEGKARDAIDVAGPRSAFPEAIAALARIDVQWADALNDQAALITAKAGPDADAKAADLIAQAKARLKAAADVLSPVMKSKDNQKSPELQLAQADYFRAQHANTSMNKALKAAQALKADDAKVALIQGMALAQEDDGAEKAIPKLKAALAATPNSARIHFRLALAYQAMKDDANASAELKETLRLSPQHERAKLAGEQGTATADGK